MNPELDNGRSGFRLDEKIAVAVALAVGIPLVLLFLLWCLGFFSAGPDDGPNAGKQPAQSAPPTAALASPAAASSPRRTAPATARNPGMVDGIAKVVPIKLAGAPEPAKGAGNTLPAEAKAELDFLRQDQGRLRGLNQGLEAQVRDLQQEFAGAKALNAKILREAQGREQQLSDFIRTLQAEFEKGKARTSALEAEVGKLRNETARLAKQDEEIKKLQGALEGERKKRAERDTALKQTQDELAALKANVAAQAEAKAAENPAVAPMKPEGNLAEQEAMKSANANLQAQVDELRKQLEAALASSARAEKKAPEAAAAAAERIRVLEAENKRLQDQLRAAPAAGARAPIRARVIETRPVEKPLPPEVRKADDLWEGAAPLNEYLRRTAKEKVQIATRDEGAKAQNVGLLLTRLKFAKGKSRVEPAEQAKLESALSQLGEAGYLLVVGYASLPGCNQQNEALSRRRAEAVTASARKRLKEGVRVQSMYFGETDQFDSEREEENQVVEIWRVGS